MSGLVLYLIRVRFISLSMAGSANRDRRFFRHRRPGSVKGFDPEEYFFERVAAGSPARGGLAAIAERLTSPDDAILLSIDWQTGLGPEPLKA
jgi:hypothetical protein